MTTWAEVREFGLGLPDAELDAGDEPTLRVKDEIFVRYVPDGPDGHDLVLRSTPFERKALLDSGNPAFYNASNDAYSVGVRLDEIDMPELEEYVTEAWRIAESRANS